MVLLSDMTNVDMASAHALVHLELTWMQYYDSHQSNQ